MRWIPPGLLQAVGQAARAGQARRFERAACAPEAAQDAILRAILRENADTEVGREHGFADVRDVETFRRRLAVVRYADLLPRFERMKRGERGVLTAEAPVWWVRTTGSSGVPKDTPLTPAFVGVYQRPLMASLWHVYRRFPDGFRGRGGYAVGSLHRATAEDGTNIASMSGFNQLRMPAIVQALYAWPADLFRVTDRATFRFLALLLASLDEITLIGGIFPVHLVQLLRDLPARAPDLARAARTGQLPDDLALTPAERALFASRVRPRRAVADRLDAAAKGRPDDAVATAWPHLRLIYCWTGATAALYVPELARICGPQVAIRDAVYSASEGWMNVPMGEDEPGGALAVDTHFFEFVPVDAYEAGSRETVLATELVPGRRYVVVLTTQAGLYRYDLQDVVECTGRWNEAPLIRFVRKVGAASSLVGEKLDEGHVTRAMATALAGDEAAWFTLVPVPGDPPGYDLWLEPGRPVDAEAVGRRLDDALRREAMEYEDHRADRSLRAVRVRLLPPGTAARVEQARADAGDEVAQTKAAHLTLDADRLHPFLRASVGTQSSPRTAEDAERVNPPRGSPSV